MSQNNFNARNAFQSHPTWKMPVNMGLLYPCFCKEVLPGDIWRVNADVLARFMPMVAPAYSEIDAYVHFFLVPHRTVWDNWTTFITGGKDGNQKPVRPYLLSGSSGFALGEMADALGIPPEVPNQKVSALQFRAIQKIWNEWYRDETLMDELEENMADGLDTTTNTTLLRRCWEKDYFTSSLPFAQRGDPIYLPLGMTAPVRGTGLSLGLTDGTYTYGLAGKANEYFDALVADGYSYNKPVSTTGGEYDSVANGARLGVVRYGPASGLEADLTEATSATINDIRAAFQVQKMLEINARGGYRYNEFIKAHFNVQTSDATLQRSEYLGGGKLAVMINEVLQTSSTDSTSPQGNMAGRGFTLGSTPKFTKSIEEYGYIIGFLSIRPRSYYQQGLERQWSREIREDEYLPVFSHLGEQAVLNKEVMSQGQDVLNSAGTPVDDDIFGFQNRYEEFRKFYSTIHGEFRGSGGTGSQGSLAYWHLGRWFENLPQLNAQFVECNPSKRIFAVADEDAPSVLVNMCFHIDVIRPLPKFGRPGLIDHY